MQYITTNSNLIYLNHIFNIMLFRENIFLEYIILRVKFMKIYTKESPQEYIKNKRIFMAVPNLNDGELDYSTQPKSIFKPISMLIFLLF